MKKIVLIGFTIYCTLSSFASDLGNSDGTINWGNYSSEVRSKWVFLTESYELEEYEDALSTLQWFYKNTPDISVSLYQMGNEILTYAEKNETDFLHKQVLRDSIIWSYENRASLFGDNANVFDREGTVAFKYLYKKKEEDEHLYKLYSNIYDMKGNDMYIQNGKYYFNSAILMYSHNKIDKSEVIDVYEKVEAFYNHSKSVYAAKPSTLSFIESTMKSDAKTFDNYVKLNCSEIESIYGEKYNESKDLDLAKKINEDMRALIAKGEKACMNSSLFLNTLNKIQDAEPTADNSMIVAKVYLEINENEKAYAALEQAASLSTDSVKTSSIYFSLAQLDATKGKNSRARFNALKSILFDGTVSEKAYSLIGDLYLASTCKSDDLLQQKAKYIAAYDMYVRAGATTKANSTKVYFPTTAEIFERNKNVGDTQITGCWIGKTVKLKAK